MKNLLKKISPRMALAIALALLMILSLALHTTGGEAKYRTQAVVSGTILYTLPQTTPDPAETTDPETTDPETTDQETTEPEAGEESAQP